MANNLPTPQSFEQLQADMLSSYASKTGQDDFNVGSTITSIFEVVALTTARASGDIFQVLKDYSVDRATGDTLKRLATENRVKLITAKPSTGAVTVTDTSFQKIFTKVYSGASSPNIGSTQLKVSDASTFTSAGSVYIGRGTANVEGPLPYTSFTAVGGYYVLNLTSPTTKFHNIGETVILAQGGNRTIPSNTAVLSPSSGASPDILFTVTASAVILDGETEVGSVQISAQTPGASGNVPRGAIKTFASPPFSGATVSNLLPLTTGKDSETDDQLRVRIKRSQASKGLGTASVVKSSVIGATPTDENATIVSSEIESNSDGAILYIDNGDGYEAKSSGVGLESIVDSALGGEQYFQLATGGRQAPIAKAFIQSTMSAPFDIIGGDTLALTVGEQTFQHIFANTDFRSPGGVTAFEITASINANTGIGFEATTANGGQNVVLRSRTEGNETLKVATPSTSGRDAATQLGLPSNEIQTLRLYKNKIPLSKDGKNASLFTQNQQLWSATIATGDALVLSVDGTANITYVVTDADFIATGLYTTVNSTNSLESWAQVLNAKLTGVTISVVGQQLKITSNLGAANRAKLSIDASSTLVTKGMFSVLVGLASQGKSSDFVLSRNTAQFQLVVPLVAGDQLTGGSSQTEARIESSQVPGGSVTLTSDAHIWLLIDSVGEIITNGVAGNTLLAISKPAVNTIRYTSTVSSAFSNVRAGDYFILWSTEVGATDRFEARVHAVTATTLDIVVTPAEYAAATTTAGIVFSEGLAILRGPSVPQKFRVQAGVKTLDQVAQELQAQSASLTFTVLEEQYLVVRTKTKDSTGRLLVVTVDTSAKLLNLPVNASDVSKDSLVAFYDTQSTEAEMPLFMHAGFSAGSAADPIDSYIVSVTSTVSLAGRDPNELIAFLHPYGTIADAQPAGEHVQETSIAGSVISLAKQPDVRRVRSVDRYYLANPLDFGSKDTAVAIIDNDTSAKSFEIPFYRRSITNTGTVSNASTFNAYDVDSGTTANFSAAFGATFDFSNFKALMQARKVLKAIGVSQTGILYHANPWGRSGEKINVGYAYPSIPNAPIGSTVEVNSTVDVRINLKSGAVVASSIDATTEWNVTITSNTPASGIDQVTYTWSGTGANPSLNLSGGEFVNIGKTTELNEKNTGIFRISTQAGFAPSSSGFTVPRPTGSAVAETNKATIVSTAISFYQNAATTAADIVTYVTANLTDFVTAKLVNDGGTSGSGVITLSTYEDTGFTAESAYLKDGINWIASSNMTASPQFTFKKPLDLPTDIGYAFNNGEEVRLIPTTMDQVRRLLNVLAVTGFTTVGTIELADRGSKLEIATAVLGSTGAVQIIGGTANSFSTPVLDSAIRIDNAIMKISVNKVAAKGVSSDQWYRLQASVVQRKDALLSSNSSVTVLANTPTSGQSTVKLSGRTLSQRYFGKPRNHVRTLGRTFRVEKQGSLVCVSHDGQSTSPAFQKAVVNFNPGAGTLNISKISGTSDCEVTIMTGNTNFNELSIGDLATIAGLPVAKNNGNFLVTGISASGKVMRVMNPNGVDEYSSGTFTFNSNAVAGDVFTVGPFTLTANTDFLIGATPTDTASNFAAVTGTLSGVTASANGIVVKVTSTSANTNVALSYTGSGSIAVATMAGDAYSSSTFAATTEVSEGDTVTFTAPFSVLNQGRYRVIRRYDNSIWFENPNVIEEEVTLGTNNVSLGFDATTSFKINASNHSIYLNWNGVGTEPSLQNAQMGDIVTFGPEFAVNNRGDWMVRQSGAKLQEVTTMPMPTGAQFTVSGVGQYFLINSAGDLNQYYVWFNVNSGNSDPSIGGKVGIQVNILNGDTAALVASKAQAVVGAAAGLTATAANGILVVTTTGFQETTPASNVTVPSPFTVNITQAGRRAFIDCINASATNESAVFVTSILLCNRPQISFSEYEATTVGDQFVATGDILTTPNAGVYTIAQVIDQDTIVVTSSMVPVTNISLNGRETEVYVQEGIAYTGYKHAVLVSAQPGAPARDYVVFDSNNQYEKINQASGVALTSLNKMNYATTVRKGLDSYRYNTGLIAEANRIIYGDPRDDQTYPGVGAAGAEIFVREPLTRRIQVSINIRIATGVPFAQIAEQVRTSVSSLVNSNDVGRSIAISDIVAVVNVISGARAVTISFPQYDTTHDIIKLAPSEKARIIDPTTDISVSQIGS